MNTVEYPTAAPENVWVILQEVSRKQEENALQMKELRKTMGGYDVVGKKSSPLMERKGGSHN